MDIANYVNPADPADLGKQAAPATVATLQYHAERDPYIVGRWVRRHEHYARHKLINYLLHAQDNAYWLVGGRRMGKTSLLRQVEFLTATEGSEWLPLFWDMQGCVTPEELSAELGLALADAAARFAPLGIDVTRYQECDAVVLLRTLNRAIASQGRQLLLLIDEGEVLVDLAAGHAAWLSRLRKALQEGSGRTILASTQYLGRLNDASAAWATSPFLFGFQLLNLWPLDATGAGNLARQTQSDFAIDANPAVVDDILRVTAQHPYLIQYLCQHLFVPTGVRSGYLRPLQADDLVVDHLLDAYFRLDFGQLTPLGQRMLYLTAENATITEEQMVALVEPQAASIVGRQLRALQEMGYLRLLGDNWLIGNEYMRRWLFENRATLAAAFEVTSGLGGRVRADTIGTLAQELGVKPPLPPPADGAGTHNNTFTAADFFVAVQRIMAAVRRLIEQDDGHKLLVNALGGGKLLLRSEEEVQIALKHWLRPLCEAANIDMNREPLTGRGYLDFKFSIGRQFRCLMEVKLFNSSRLEEGVGIQLPLYLLADQATYGIYVPVFLEDTHYAASVEQLHRLAAERGDSHRFQIVVMDIRTWKPKSASKAEELEALERYYLPCN